MEEVGEGEEEAWEGEGKGEGEDPCKVCEEQSKEEANMDAMMEVAEVPPALDSKVSTFWQPETGGRSEQEKDDNSRSQS